MSEAIVRIYESELAPIVHEASLYLDIETGGSLLGLWTAAGNPTILLASRPGPRAIRGVTQFEQDLDVHRVMEDALLEHHGVQSVGLWHSHHRLGLSELSGGDIRRTVESARRSARPFFCDLLCYFTDGRDPATGLPEVTIKPYVYSDAGSGQRMPTSLVVLPGVSPLRPMLPKLPLPGRTAQELEVALAPAPHDWRGRWRTARSIELAHRDDEDGQAENRGGIWPFRRGRQGSEEAPDGSQVPRSADWAEGGGYDIPDLGRYLSDHLERELHVIPKRVTCELEAIHGGRGFRLTLVSPDRSEERELHLGWDGKRPVVTRCIVRLARSQTPKDLLSPGDVRDLGDVLKVTARSLGEMHGG